MPLLETRGAASAKALGFTSKTVPVLGTGFIAYTSVIGGGATVNALCQPGPSGMNYARAGLYVDNSGNIYMTSGYNIGPNSAYGAALLKFNSTGTVQWARGNNFYQYYLCCIGYVNDSCFWTDVLGNGTNAVYASGYFSQNGTGLTTAGMAGSAIYYNDSGTIQGYYQNQGGGQRGYNTSFGKFGSYVWVTNAYGNGTNNLGTVQNSGFLPTTGSTWTNYNSGKSWNDYGPSSANPCPYYSTVYDNGSTMTQFGMFQDNSNVVYAQVVNHNISTSPATPNWKAQIYSGTEKVQFCEGVRDSNGNFYTVGWSDSGKAFLVKYNSSGTIQFQKAINQSSFGTQKTTLTSLAIDSSDVLYACGTTYVGGTPVNGAFIVSFDTSGVIQWKNTLSGTSNSATGLRISVDNTGYFYLVATSGANSNSVITCKLPSTGAGAGTYQNYVYAAETATSASSGAWTTTTNYAGSSNQSYNYSNKQSTAMNGTLTTTTAKAS